MIAADTLFIQLEDGPPIPGDALNIVTRALSAILEVEQASIMTPARISSSAPRSPALLIEIDFRNPSALEAFLAKSAARDDFQTCISIVSSLAQDAIAYQAMSRRSAFSSAPTSGAGQQRSAPTWWSTRARRTTLRLGWTTSIACMHRYLLVYQTFGRSHRLGRRRSHRTLAMASRSRDAEEQNCIR